MTTVWNKDWTFDRIVPLVALAVLTLLFCMTRYADYDLWWHLKLGETIVAKQSIPWQDAFSYTAAGRGQFTGEWLADALIFLTFKAGGFLGLNLLKAALLITALCFTWLQIRAEGDGTKRSFVAAVITLLLVLFALRFRLFVRPYLFSLPFLAGFLYLLSKWRAGSSGREIYALPLLMLFWANMSVGAVFGIFVIGLATLQDVTGSRSWRLLPVLLLSLLASLANPESWRLYTLAIDLTSDPYRALIGEYQPVTLDILFGSGLRYTLGFQILAVGGILYFILLRGWKNLFQLLLFAFLLYESCRQIRLVELFSLVAAPSFALLLSRLFALLPEKAGRFATAGNYAVALLILALIPSTVFNSSVYAFGVGPKEAAFPDGALNFLQEQKIAGRMFNSYGFGGYIIWRGEGRKVFIDGRYRRLYTPAEYGEYKGALESAEAWQAAEQKYGFDYALLEYDLLSQRFPVHLSANPQWALVYWDNHSLVYVKRTAERAALIAAREYKVARPTFLDLGYLDAYQEKGAVNEALAGLEREVALNPDNQFVLLARIFLRYQQGKLFLPQIRADLERLLPMKPDFAMKHSALAMVLAASGESERAKREVEKALKLDPFDQAALSQAKDLGITVKLPKGGIPGHP
jgi:tetratricopeptide (TPR) repeat protein